jgi:hypothetical protein
MLVRSRNVDVLDQLNDRVRRVRAVSADLMLHLIEATSAHLPEMNGTRKAAVVHRLIKCRARTNAALALLEIELPQWKLRRLVFEDGKWLCSLSRQINMPPALDDGVEATHSVMPLAILGAVASPQNRVRASEMCQEPFWLFGRCRIPGRLTGRALIARLETIMPRASAARPTPDSRRVCAVGRSRQKRIGRELMNNRPMISFRVGAGGGCPHGGRHFRDVPHRNSTGTPLLTSLASSSTSQFVSRTQPCEYVLSIFDGSGVPWMP